MHIEFLVEEASAEAALNEIVPGIVGKTATFRIHPHEGKRDLLAKLPGRLMAYARWIPDDWRIVVLLDEDRQDCRRLKSDLENVAGEAGLRTKRSGTPRRPIQVLNRIAVEEIEAWFFGDIAAVRAAYPRVRESLGAKARYRDPDAIAGGTWEALERVLQKAGYHQGGFAKIGAAQAIARHMDPDRNASRSFRHFRDGLRGLIA